MKKLLIPLLLLILVLSGCDSPREIADEDAVTINFETNGGTPVNAVRLEINQTYSINVETTKEGYTFDNWYVDEAMTATYRNKSIISIDQTLYAKWIPIETFAYFYFGDTYLGARELKYGESLDLPEATVPVHTFLAWYDDENFETEITTIIGTTENQYIYGDFEETIVNVPTEGAVNLSTLPYYAYLSDSNPVITIQVKDIGVMTLQLFPSVAKNTVDNMIKYIVDGDYTGSSFHRVIENFMIQGGIVSDTNCPVPGEFSSNNVVNNLSHYRGVLSVARTSDMDSGTSQFFIMHVDYPYLDGDYASFGGLISGFNVLDFMATELTDNGDAPYRDMTIESITVDLNGYVPGAIICAD